MAEPQAVRVEKLPSKPEISADAVHRVAADRELDRLEVDAELVRPPRLQTELEKRTLAELCRKLAA